jgi:hypothetical protein
MRIYLLVPLHTSDPIWMFSIQREAIQVIAPSESEARLRASLRYSRRRTGERAVEMRDPWLDPRWVYAHVVEATDPAMPVLGWDPIPQVVTRPVQASVPAPKPDEPRSEPSRR